MSALAEFLSQEAKRLEEERPVREAALREWLSAIGSLFQQFEEWIRAADDKKIVRIEYGEATLRENRLGTYRVKTIIVTVDSQSVSFEPRARYVGGVIHVDGLDAPIPAEGRVDGMVWGTADESIYRAKVGDVYQWLIARRSTDVSKNRYVPLTQPLFERFLLNLLS